MSLTYLLSTYSPRSPVTLNTSTTTTTLVYSKTVKNLTLSSPTVVDVTKRIVASIYIPPKASLALVLGATLLSTTSS
jgi:hypothetical protein